MNINFFLKRFVLSLRAHIRKSNRRDNIYHQPWKRLHFKDYVTYSCFRSNSKIQFAISIWKKLFASKAAVTQQYSLQLSSHNFWSAWQIKNYHQTWRSSRHYLSDWAKYILLNSTQPYAIIVSNFSAWWFGALKRSQRCMYALFYFDSVLDF
jgi:hypothetical protein